MPKVGNKKAGGMKFPNKKNMNEAFNYAKQSGKPMQVEGNYMGGGKVMPKYQMGGRVGARPMARPMARPGRRPMGRPGMGMNPIQKMALRKRISDMMKHGGKVSKKKK